MTAQQMESLSEFINHVNGLHESRFGKRVLAQNSITLRSVQSTVEFINFDEEECRSFLLGFRMLLQDNDCVSIHNIWKLFAENADAEWYEKINPPRWMLNDYLDQEAVFADGSGKPITNRVILDTFLYGLYAHYTPRHRTRFKQWEANQQQFHPLKLLFIMDLKVILNMAGKMSAVVQEWLCSQASKNP